MRHELFRQQRKMEVEGNLGREYVPVLHDLPQLAAIYVLCAQKAFNEQWAKNYKKPLDRVNGVFIDTDELVRKLSIDQTEREKLENDATIPLSFYNRSVQSSTSLNDLFMWFQVFIDVLLRMEHPETGREKLLGLCRKLYDGNLSETAILDQFETNYQSEMAIWWYTRGSCHSRILDKALRIQDLEILFYFHFFIADLYEQLKQDQKRFLDTSHDTNLYVYRCHVMSTKEFNQIKENVGEFLSINSFLSTSKNKTVALEFVKRYCSSVDLQPVLFQIEINTLLETKPYSDISHLSYSGGENKILIMLGTIFQIVNVTFDKEYQVWTVQLTMLSENDDEFKDLFDNYTKDMGAVNVGSLGSLLQEMDELDKAEIMYRKHLEIDPVEGAASYTNLGDLNNSRGRYDEALEILNIALNIQQNSSSDNHLAIATTFHNMGDAYQGKKEYKQALENYEQALTKYNTSSLPMNHPNIIEVKASISKVNDLMT
ncbi:unnamed protein product [Didymodactylos carnosus]|uniref:Tetratricopeptide repeat protein n=1 Tax=Didymodactylos carnosus TaxID=1234261 RepID=A0A8S2DEA3_9BILA|nr:unnamed protein product [Didymodactylos carnosus]CAF3719463.1 unnamed protein product [Didymodactylos carnosus]